MYSRRDASFAFLARTAMAKSWQVDRGKDDCCEWKTNSEGDDGDFNDKLEKNDGANASVEGIATTITNNNAVRTTETFIVVMLEQLTFVSLSKNGIVRQK